MRRARSGARRISSILSGIDRRRDLREGGHRMTAYDPAATAPPMPDRRKFWRRILWLLLLLPLLPTILILLIAMTADLKGCMTEPTVACMIGPLSLGQAFAVSVNLALWLGSAFMALAPFWVTLCCLAVHR